MLTSDVFPPHEASLHLTHNDHKTNYQTVAEWWEDAQAMRRMDDEDWVSPEQKQKAIETNELWELQWYPDTPIGFLYLAAADLDALLEAVKSYRKGSDAS